MAGFVLARRSGLDFLHAITLNKKTTALGAIAVQEHPDDFQDFIIV